MIQKIIFGSGVIHDKDYIGMSSDSSINYEIGIIKPGETKELDIYLYIVENDKQTVEEMWKNIENIRKSDVANEEQAVQRYWKKYVKEHIQKDDIVLTLGAGTVTNIGPMLVK